MRKKPGELLDDSPWAFAFRLLEPVPETPCGLLVLLHGVDGDENQLAALGAGADPRLLVALPRGPRSIAGDRCGWFREGFGEDGPEAVADEAEESRLKLIEFVGQLQQRYGVDPSATVVAGFSQGGMLGASAALTAPAAVGGFAMLGGRLLPEIEPLLPPPAQLAHLRALLVHGRHDATLPVEWLQDAQARLRDLGIACETRLHEAGHELTAGMGRDLLEWLRADPRLRPP